MPPAPGLIHVIDGVSPGGHVAAKGAFLPEVFPISGQKVVPGYTGGFPYLTRFDGILQSSTNVQQVAKRFVLWVNEEYRAQASANLDGFWPTRIDTPYIEMLRLMYEDAKPELDILTEVMAASAEYHGMDYSIAPYENHIHR